MTDPLGSGHRHNFETPVYTKGVLTRYRCSCGMESLRVHHGYNISMSNNKVEWVQVKWKGESTVYPTGV
jgi:hypothetical protein